jgi:hypothetical protein
MSESLRIVGGLLSPELLGRVFAGDAQVAGTSPESYGLERGESVRRQASKLWPYLLESWPGPEQDGMQPDERKRTRFIRILLREFGFPQPMPDHIAFRATGWDVDLDHRTPNREARAPHAVMQEQLNQDDSRLWGILTNGTTFRLLRDSASLVTAQYLEFDLKAIFDGELFADFVQFYLTCHATRFDVHGDGGPESCYLEQWRTASASQGERALEQLRKGVEKAISLLGTGFISHPSNPQLRTRLASNELRLDDLNRALLRVVYRILFWFVAEDRDALLLPNVSAETREPRERYLEYFSAARLRKLARNQRGTKHTDLFDAVTLVFDALGTEGGVPDLAIPGIGGIFETGALDQPLAGTRLTNEALLDAVRALAVVRSRDGGALRRVDFGNLGAEELGSVYESLLELIPHYDQDKREYTLTVLAGNERKESGSYYTPSSLVECLLDSALDPLLDEACSKGTPEEKVARLLDLTVCDPACGSGHFLVAAARRIAKRIAAEETGESEPPEPEIRRALRRVVGRCIYGVDVNPMAAELAKVSLWLEALEPGKPLSYLDQNIRVGNSLLGVTPALLADGLPDAAFTAIEGDDKKVCTALKKQNHDEREYGKHDLFSQAGISVTNTVLAKQADTIAHTLPDSLEDLHIHQQRQAEALATSNERRIQKLLADAWCAAFVQPKTLETRATAITHATLERFSTGNDGTLDQAATENLVADLTRQYRFFHWHIEFPHIFRVGGGSPEGWAGGFSAVIGNPPWEKVELKEQEFFAQRSPEIANAPNQAARKKLIAQLPYADPTLYAEFANEQRRSAGWTHFLKETGRFPLTGQGRLNTYAVFAETARVVVASGGRSGLILPTGIATDATTAPFFQDIVEHSRLDSLLDFVTNPLLWTDVGNRRFRFSILVVTGSRARAEHAEFATLTKHPSALSPRGQRIHVSSADLLLVNPNTGTCPMFQTQRDADITIGIYQRVPILWRDASGDNPWDLSFMQGLFNMATDSGLFRTKPDGDVLPLYEAKLIHQFDHRLSSYDKRPEGSQDTELPRLDLNEKNDPWRSPVPRYWVERKEVDARLARREWDRRWVLGWRDIARSTDERTMISAIIPRMAVGDKFLLAFTDKSAPLLVANLSSFILDYVARQKFAGTSLKYYLVKQFPVLPPYTYDDELRESIESRVLELTYTAWDMEPFARDLGDDGPPFRWDEERRFLMRAELDALYFHLYGIPRDDVDYIMETFPIVKRKDIAAHGTYRTKDTILSIYDGMPAAEAGGTNCQTRLTPPPGHGPRHLSA